MNERIRGLASKVWYHGNLEEQNENIQMFAELIVRECGVIAYKTYCQTPGALGIQYKQAIEKHFGVEL